MSRWPSVRRALGLGLFVVVFAAAPAGAIPVTGREHRDVPVAVDVIKAIDIARANPTSIADTLKNLGDPDVREAAAFLRRQRPLPPIPMDGRLNASALGHANDLGANGSASHVGSDGSSLRQRIERQGIIAPIVAENLSLGQTSAMDVVRQLIIDKGVPTRGHRMDIFSTTYVIIGVGCAPHTRYRVVCVIDYASKPMAPAGSETPPK